MATIREQFIGDPAAVSDEDTLIVGGVVVRAGRDLQLENRTAPGAAPPVDAKRRALYFLSLCSLAYWIVSSAR